jgi:hypothetical protein
MLEGNALNMQSRELEQCKKRHSLKEAQKTQKTLLLLVFYEPFCGYTYFENALERPVRAF